MSLEKVICPQCGSNEIELFGSAAYKCESCGTVMKDNQPKSAPVFRSKREFRSLDDGYNNQSDFSDDHVEASNQFITGLFWILIITGIALGAIMLFSQ